MISRDTSEPRMPSCPIEMPSDTAIVTNSSGKPPASRTPCFDRLASRSRGMLHGVTSFHDDATPTCALPQSASVMPTARNIARAGARSMPSVTSWLRGFISGISAGYRVASSPEVEEHACSPDTRIRRNNDSRTRRPHRRGSVGARGHRAGLRGRARDRTGRRVVTHRGTRARGCERARRRPYEDVDALIAACDAVAIAVTPDAQPDLAVRAVEAGKSVLLEKPLAADLAGAHRADRCDRARRRRFARSCSRTASIPGCLASPRPRPPSTRSAAGAASSPARSCPAARTRAAGGSSGARCSMSGRTSSTCTRSRSVRSSTSTRRVIAHGWVALTLTHASGVTSQGSLCCRLAMESRTEVECFGTSGTARFDGRDGDRAELGANIRRAFADVARGGTHPSDAASWAPSADTDRPRRAAARASDTDGGPMTAPIASVDECLAVLARGHAVKDEPALDVLAHSLQCGAILRVEAPERPRARGRRAPARHRRRGDARRPHRSRPARRRPGAAALRRARRSARRCARARQALPRHHRAGSTARA